jgi:hypothetical protein
MDKRADNGVEDQGVIGSVGSDQWQVLNDLDLACVGGGIGDTVL